MIDDDIEYHDEPCPNCGAETTYYRDCSELGCEDGYIDCYEDDPINYAQGESEYPCPTCHGHGAEHWCPKCGFDFFDPRNADKIKQARTAHNKRQGGENTKPCPHDDNNGKGEQCSCRQGEGSPCIYDDLV